MVGWKIGVSKITCNYMHINWILNILNKFDSVRALEESECVVDLIIVECLNFIKENCTFLYL